ncbi:MAG: ferredoxin [Oscillospiraceae bacterium]
MEVTMQPGCIGCGLCVSTCPRIFRMGDNGEAMVDQEVTPEEEAAVSEAAGNCPVSVITIAL